MMLCWISRFSGIRQVLDVEELLHLLHAVLCEVDCLLLLIDDEIAGLLDLLAHEGVDLGELAARLAPLKLAREDIAGLVELGGLAALAGNDQRRPGLIDEDGVDLVDDREVQASLHQLLLVDDHVVPEVIKAELIVRHIRDIAVVGWRGARRCPCC